MEGANALICSLELIKTEGAAAVKALGLYLIGSSAEAKTPPVLYSSYHAGHPFTEFTDEASLIAAFKVPGVFQNLLISRLLKLQQSIFGNLFASTAGHLSEITLVSIVSPIPLTGSNPPLLRAAIGPRNTGVDLFFTMFMGG